MNEQQTFTLTGGPHFTPEFKRGDQVVGLRRGDTEWTSRPTGTVTQTYRRCDADGAYAMGERIYRVAWHGTCVEDDMLREEIERMEAT